MGMGELIVATISLVLGVGTAALIREIREWSTGRKAEERTAWTERDHEAKARRLLENALHCANRRLIDAGLPPIDWPEY